MSGFDKRYIQRSDPYKAKGSDIKVTRTIYYGEVKSIEDDSQGGRIKVKIKDLDNRTAEIDKLPWCYPLLPKYFHVLPQVGEMVRVFIEDPKYPEFSRFWIGSIISQPQKIGFDNKYTALSTTNQGVTAPEAAPSTFPNANGVFPDNKDIAIVGRINTDVLLKPNEVYIRAGKHENEDILKLNTKNPAQISLIFEQQEEKGDFYSSTTILSDKIALISHSGKPKFKAADLDSEDRIRIFKEGHPLGRADVLVQILEIYRNAILNHIHGYSGLESDKTAIINELEKIDLSSIIQENIVIN